ncbi:unnamed protein product [Medioppia subpectinata]|uniref:non-specific serine/threonine protein kinase n=1 Tax=Medioppia subpectinata TaxID=1979941 RepID=A0A7R9KRW3_9ACAR|nr:unnamed protein product [Medioppia subpectinata]CAG2108675.1 unnamed protein product [Medioppia subpectinata]
MKNNYLVGDMSTVWPKPRVSNVLNDYKICKLIPNHLKCKTKLFVIFADIDKNNTQFDNNIILITTEDKAYGLGANSCGFLGLDQTSAVKEPQHIKELSFIGICDFSEGYDFMIAQTSDGDLISWGNNNKGQLGRGYTNYDHFVKPAEIVFPQNEYIVQISCGRKHSLALTSDGKVYGWGDNTSGQVSGKPTDNISAPLKLALKNKIKYVFAGFESSYAVTIDGQVYSWGRNEYGILGHDNTSRKPRLVTGLKDVIKVCGNKLNSYFLTSDQYVYFCGAVDAEIVKKNSNVYQSYGNPMIFNMNKVLDIYCSHFEAKPLELLVEKEFVYQCYNKQFIKTNFGNFFEYFKGKQITYKTLHLDSDGILSTRGLFITPKDKTFKTVDRLVYACDGKFETTFNSVEPINIGAFGSVFKVINKTDGKLYAVKKISIENKSVYYKGFREFQTMTKLNNESIIEYKTAWIEDNQFVYIQMQYCDYNLRNILDTRMNAFNRQSTKTPISLTEYYLFLKIFSEINQGLEYLHSLVPPIIHRDLKPQNILVVRHNPNGWFVKISDFGLSVFHESGSQSHTQRTGTEKYMAPEVKFSGDYNTKCDIFSFGLIACEMFGIDFYSSIEVSERNHFAISDQMFQSLVDTLFNMIDRYHEKRPTSADIQALINNCTVDRIDGLEYLHSSDPPIIHRDLKPENILVGHNHPMDWFVKISDFGLSVFDESGSQSHTRGAGTEKYMAPETCKRESLFPLREKEEQGNEMSEAGRDGNPSYKFPSFSIISPLIPYNINIRDFRDSIFPVAGRDGIPSYQKRGKRNGTGNDNWKNSPEVSKRNHFSISDQKFESLVNTLFNMIDRYHEKRPTSAHIQALINNCTVNAIDL